jgi:DNA-binding MarR family transcriptional regulator
MYSKSTLSREILDLVSIVKKLVRQEFNVDSVGTEPTLTQYRILRRIQMGVRHVGKLADAFGISQPATSIMVTALVKDGYIKRVAHSTDRRLIELHLTPKAISKIEKGHKRTFAKMDARLCSLAPKKRQEITENLRELARLLSENTEVKN